MNSAAEGHTIKKRRPRGDEARIVVQRSPGVVALHYRGSDPETRYQPRERSVWSRIRESFRMG